MKPARLLKTDGQVTLTVKLSRGGQINETRAVQFKVEPAEEAFQRFLPLSKMVTEIGVLPKFREAFDLPNPVRDAATDAYNAINSTLQTLLACDHVSMLRHPPIVDELHRALNGLKRALHQNAELSHRP